jgi:hypothetical protein
MTHEQLYIFAAQWITSKVPPALRPTSTPILGQFAEDLIQHLNESNLSLEERKETLF